ncbi:MAG TPA: hypothetical protein VGX96_03650 [Candidatus Elarobacter sp.]|nr:hypothetical protein [Candidatus Elarobacter sp.]
MPLQNRVTPFGEIVALPGRGTLMGNRGVVHNDDRRIVRPWQVRRWIACRLEFRGRRRRALMQPRRWTELFFLDEAAAFAAGHRPCGECRNADYRRFRALWERVHGGPADADAMDRVLHEQRAEGRRKRTYRARLADLPDGAYVALDGAAWLLWRGELLEWTDGGYARRVRIGRSAEADVLTPPSMIALIGAGYEVAVHPSAEGHSVKPA